MREEGGSRRSERKNLKSVDHGGAVSMSRSPNRVVVNRVVIGRNCLKRGGMRVGQSAARCPEDVPNLQILKAFGLGREESLED